jgi:hypothetical protein
LLSEARGLKHLVKGRAIAKIDRSSLQLLARGDPSADKSYNVTAVILPSDLADDQLPTKPSQIQCVGGWMDASHAVYVKPEAKPLPFAPMITDLLAPKTYIGAPPMLVYAWKVVGGEATDITSIIITGKITVTGVSYTVPW